MSRTMLVVSLLVGGVLAGAVPAVAQKRDRDRITREEILGSAQRDLDLFTVVRALRPHFLARPRGNRTLGGSALQPTALIVDGNRAGELTAMRMITARTVQEVRYLEPSRAEDQYGLTANGGAVVVTLLKGVPPDTLDLRGAQ